MPNLLAMSFEGELAPAFDFKCLQPGRTPPDGWGVGFYPNASASAVVLKEHAPAQGSLRGELMKAWDHVESSLFITHIREAEWGSISESNTQPFCRSWGRRDWLFAHSGSLQHRLELKPNAVFEPVGSTDSELVFCELMARFMEQGWRAIGDSDPQVVLKWLNEINGLGHLSCALTDGRDLILYADRRASEGLYLWEVLPPYAEIAFGDIDLEIDLAQRGVKSRKGIIASSSPVGQTRTQHPVTWKTLRQGNLIVLRQGAVMTEVSGDISTFSPPAPHFTSPHLIIPTQSEAKRFNVIHQTRYRYAIPVERSVHQIRLTPMHDRLQNLAHHQLELSVHGQQRDYEDVFGNRVRRLFIETSFNEMLIESKFTVDLLDKDPLNYRPLKAHSTIPLVWMPWHRQVLQPYLLPPELPESQLRELVDYAMSFVERNDYNLLDTLLDINSTIFREYSYLPGTTTVYTTPFEVYEKRRGVCQDFTVLFICLARLLDVPARYVCGYIYTGPKNPNHRQSEASHAWAQVYLPEVGWKGFDPTNGILTQTDHIRVAVGRSYVDATPTSGTIFIGGGSETLEVSVQVELVSEPG